MRPTLVVLAAFAASSIAQAQPRGAKQFYAVMWHKCQGDKFIGHDCYTMGEGFTDCDWAFRALKKIECCKWAIPKGQTEADKTANSIEWRMDGCSWIMPKIMKDAIDASKQKEVDENGKDL